MSAFFSVLDPLTRHYEQDYKNKQQAKQATLQAQQRALEEKIARQDHMAETRRDMATLNAQMAASGGGTGSGTSGNALFRNLLALSARESGRQQARHLLERQRFALDTQTRQMLGRFAKRRYLIKAAEAASNEGAKTSLRAAAG
ncbi:MAG: hypothetical protein GDA54_01680 [Alphaproteobacteria bacterium GM7ARS4]|nr:hypothetical protein [Alphaproteobacteria bacterium GM7ARS4]